MAITENSITKQGLEVYNDLVSTLSDGIVSAEDLKATNLSEFIDRGARILSSTDLTNGYISNLMNKIALSIDTARGYEDSYKDLVKGTITSGNTIELINHSFLQVEEAEFGAALPEDGKSVDQWKIKRPEVTASYYVKSNIGKLMATINENDLQKAFTSPEQLLAFNKNIQTYLINSYRLALEAGRVGMIADAVVGAVAEAKKNNAIATTTTKNATVYDLRAAYAAIKGADYATKSYEELINDIDFNKFVYSTVKRVAKRMTKPSTKFNPQGAIKTFSPEGTTHMYLSSDYTAASESIIPVVGGTPVYPTVGNYTEVPYFQYEDDPHMIYTEQGKVKNVLGFIADDFALAEFIVKERMTMTPENANGLYYNMFINFERRYCVNRDANFVVFVIGDEYTEA